MSERGPSGTGHDTACECDAPRCERDGCQDKPTPPDPPVAVPGPASEPICPGCKRPVSECQAEDVYEVVDAPGPASVSPADTRIEALERALRIIETEVYGRPEPFCRRIAAEIVEVLGVAPQ